MGRKAQLIAPSGVVLREAFQAGADVMEQLGIEAHWHPEMFDVNGFFAGDDDRRAQRLVAALRDDSDLLWMTRGGYGAIRTLHSVAEPWEALPPKELWGFSDGTCLLAHWDKLGWPAWHAPPLIQLPRLDPCSLHRVVDVWKGEAPAPIEGLKTLVPGRAMGPIGGGNLCVLSSMVGTPWEAQLKGKIVLLEDVGEAPYKIHRLFTQLALAGALDGVKGFVFGAFTDVGESELMDIHRVIRELTETLAAPVAWGAPIGHGEQNYSLPYGRGSNWVAELVCDANGTAMLGFSHG